MMNTHINDLQEQLERVCAERDALREALARKSKLADAGCHLALSLQDIRNTDWTPSPETNNWHRNEALRLAEEANDEFLQSEIESLGDS